MSILYGEIPVSFSSPHQFDEHYVGCDSIEPELLGAHSLESDDSGTCWTDLRSWDQNREYPMDDYRNAPPQVVNGASPISYLCLEDEAHIFAEQNAQLAETSSIPVLDLGNNANAPNPLEYGANSDYSAPEGFHWFTVPAENQVSAYAGWKDPILCPMPVDSIAKSMDALQNYRADAIESEVELQQLKNNLLLAIKIQHTEEKKCELGTANYREHMMRFGTYLQQQFGSLIDSLKQYGGGDESELKNALDSILTSEYHQTEAIFCERMNTMALENPSLHIRESKNIADAWDNAAGLLEVLLEDQFLLDTLDSHVRNDMSEIEGIIDELELEKAKLVKESSWLLKPVSV